jgi:hypothetical protein
LADEQERQRQARVEKYLRRKAEAEAEQRAKEDAERVQANVKQQTVQRVKEYKLLKKKRAKVEGMLEDAQAQGKDTTKLFQKRDECILVVWKPLMSGKKRKKS